jgi:hypothetical protein
VDEEHKPEAYPELFMPSPQIKRKVKGISLSYFPFLFLH